MSAPDLPLPVGTRIVSHPFEHYGVVGEASDPHMCEVILDEPLKHTDRVWKQWHEVEAEDDYTLRVARKQFYWAERAADDATKAVASAEVRFRAAVRERQKAAREMERLLALREQASPALDEARS